MEALIVNLEMMDSLLDGIAVLLHVTPDLSCMAVPLESVWLGGAGLYGLAEKQDVFKVQYNCHKLL